MTLPGLRSGGARSIVTAAFILWSIIYLGRAIDALRTRGERFGADDLATLSPLGWEHVNFTGDYVWEDQTKLDPDGFRPSSCRPEAKRITMPL